jgi:CheY-like chemotaxis protein
MSDMRGKVLVIDDEPSIVELLKEYLSEQGFEVVTASGGADGLARLGADRPDVVLLDMRMPEMDGIETLKRIRAVNLRVPVLLVSANDDLAAAKEAIALGAFDYTLKPIDFAYLNRALDKMLASVSPVLEIGLGHTPPTTTGSPHGLLYDLALEVFRVTRGLPQMSRESVGAVLEQAALALVQRGGGGEKTESVRALNQIRALLRFAKDLGDITDDAHRTLESHIARARRSVGLS